MRRGTVYSETVVHSAPQEFVKDAPYQLAIISLDGGVRLTARIEGERAVIGDRVEQAADSGGEPRFRKVP